MIATGPKRFSIGLRTYCFTGRDCSVGSVEKDLAVVSSGPKEKMPLLFWKELVRVSRHVAIYFPEL